MNIFVLTVGCVMMLQLLLTGEAGSAPQAQGHNIGNPGIGHIIHGNGKGLGHDPCESLLCLNGGTCSTNQDGIASCACADGFSGDNCCVRDSGLIVCEGGAFYLDCPAPSTILITEAIYGRTESAVVCPYITAPLTTNCTSTTSDGIVKGSCNGQHRCQFTVTNALLGGDPCPGTYKYLQVTYTCA